MSISYSPDSTVLNENTLLLKELRSWSGLLEIRKTSNRSNIIQSNWLILKK